MDSTDYLLIRKIRAAEEMGLASLIMLFGFGITACIINLASLLAYYNNIESSKWIVFFVLALVGFGMGISFFTISFLSAKSFDRQAKDVAIFGGMKYLW